MRGGIGCLGVVGHSGRRFSRVSRSLDGAVVAGCPVWLRLLSSTLCEALRGHSRTCSLLPRTDAFR